MVDTELKEMAGLKNKTKLVLLGGGSCLLQNELNFNF